MSKTQAPQPPLLYHFGGPYNKDCSVWGVYIGVRLFWETAILDVQYGWVKAHGSSLRGLGFGEAGRSKTRFNNRHPSPRSIVPFT